MSGKRQPRTILLKATQWVPIEHPARICSIDIARHQKCLGWEDYDVDLVEAVLDIPGNHYSIFAADNVCETPFDPATYSSNQKPPRSINCHAK